MKIPSLPWGKYQLVSSWRKSMKRRKRRRGNIKEKIEKTEEKGELKFKKGQINAKSGKIKLKRVCEQIMTHPGKGKNIFEGDGRAYGFWAARL